MPWTAERQRKRTERLKRAGRCVRCGEPRGKDGTATLCRPHADELMQRAARMRNGHVSSIGAAGSPQNIRAEIRERVRALVRNEVKAALAEAGR